LRAEPLPRLLDDDAMGGPASRSPSCIVLAGCAPISFRYFVLPFAASLARNGSLDCAVELHVIGADRWIAGEAEALRAAVSSLPIACRELSGLRTESGLTGDGVFTLFASAHFFQLPALLRRYRVPVLALDLDSLVEGPLDALVAKDTEADVVLTAGSGSDDWNRIAPSPLLVRPTAPGIAFAELVARYIAHFLRKGIAPRQLDQIALSAACRNEQDRGGAARIVQRAADEWPLSPGLSRQSEAMRLQLCAPYLPRLRRVCDWTLPGCDTFFHTQLPYSRILLGRPTWAGSVLEACLAQTAGRRRALDIGAHIGFWSRWLAAHFEHVDAFEPHALLRECLHANVDAANLTVHGCALGDRNGAVAINLGAENTGTSHVVESASGEVPLRRLDEFAFIDVDFIKIDVEGYELFVLRGSVATLRRNLPLVLVEQNESNERYGISPLAAVSFLEALGARVVGRPSKVDYLLGWESPDSWREAAS